MDDQTKTLLRSLRNLGCRAHSFCIYKRNWKFHGDSNDERELEMESKHLVQIFTDCYHELEDFIKSLARRCGVEVPSQEEQRRRHCKIIDLVKDHCPFAVKPENELLIDILGFFRISRNSMTAGAKAGGSGLEYHTWIVNRETGRRERKKDLLPELGDHCEKLCKWIERMETRLGSQETVSPQPQVSEKAMSIETTASSQHEAGSSSTSTDNPGRSEGSSSGPAERSQLIQEQDHQTATGRTAHSLQPLQQLASVELVHDLAQQWAHQKAVDEPGLPQTSREDELEAQETPQRPPESPKDLSDEQVFFDAVETYSILHGSLGF